MNRTGFPTSLLLIAAGLLAAPAAARAQADEPPAQPTPPATEGQVPSKPAAAGADPAELLGADTFLYVVMPDPAATWKRFQKTSWWALHEDAAMREFVAPLRTALKKKIDEGLREFWGHLEMERPEGGLPTPSGPVALGLHLVPEKRQRTVYDWENWDEQNEPTAKEITVTEPALRFSVVAEFGERAQTAQRIATRLARKATEEGHMQRRREQVHGVELTTFRPAPRPDEPDAQPAAKDNAEALCYAFRGSRLVIGNDPKAVRDILRRLAGAGRPGLGEDAGMRNILRRLQAPGDAAVYFNIRALLRSLKTMIPDDEKEQAQTVFRALGLEKFHGVGLVLRVVPDAQRDLDIELLATAEAPKPPLLEVLTPAALATTGHRQLTANLAGFLVANYDVGKVVRQVGQMVQAAGGPPLLMALQAGMAMTGGEDGARPPVNIAEDVLGQLPGPVMVLYRLVQPYTRPGAQRIRLAVGVRDAGVLDTALGRIHDTFLARGNKEMRRELRGTSIYLLPNMGFGLVAIGGQTVRPGTDPDQEPAAMAVVGSSLAIGPASAVTQAVRDRGREDLRPVQTDARYRHAARFLPAQAGAWGYDDGISSAGFLWENLKEHATKEKARDPGVRQRRRGGDLGEDFPEDFPDDFPMGRGPLPSPISQILRQFDLEDAVDFTTLPPFAAVRKYFGPSIGFLKATEDGLRLKMTLCKPPAEE